MSLCEVGEGLLKTHVTWEDVEEALSQSLGVKCKFGEKRTLSHIGAGRGFLSHIALIDADWETPTGKVPDRIAVKICSQLPQMEFDGENAQTPAMQNLFKKMHNSEVDAYEIFEKYRTPGLKAAHLFAARRFSETNPSKGFLVLPFFENLEPVHIVDNMDMEEVVQVLDAIAEMNAVTLRLSKKESLLFGSSMFSTVCGTYFTKEMVTQHMNTIRRFAGEFYPETVEKLDEIKFKVTDIEYFKHMDKLCEKLGMTPLITHGDLWTTNLLWSKTDKIHKLEAICDYQSPALSTPAVDVCSFICSALSGKERIEKTDFLLEKYYSILREKVTREMPFSLEQLKESFIHIFPFHGWEILGTLVEIYSDFVENEKEERNLPPFEQILEKMNGLMESILFYYDLCKTGKRW